MPGDAGEVRSVVDTLTRRGLADAVRDHMKGEGQEWLESRRDKDRFLSEHIFDREKLQELDEGTLRQLVRRLWAYSLWSNPDYVLDKMLEAGLDTIRSSFEFLLFSDAPLAERFDRVLSNVPWMAGAGASEILCHYEKARYPIWNSRAREGLLELGLPEEVLPGSRIDGAEYEAYSEIMRDILAQAQEEDDFFEDLFILDYVLYYVSTVTEDEPTVRREPSAREAEEDFEHDEAIEHLLVLGDGLGFEVEDEVKVAPGAQVDAIWRTRIANLGTISYAFEVQRRGARDSAILNLQKVLHEDSSIRKVVIVSTEAKIERFRNEIESLDERFRNSVEYLRVADLLTALDHLDGLKQVLAGVGLLEQAV